MIISTLKQDLMILRTVWFYFACSYNCFILRCILVDFGVGTFILFILLNDHYYLSCWFSYYCNCLQIPNQKCSCSFNCCCHNFDFSNVFTFLTAAIPFVIIISLHPSASLSNMVMIIIIIPLTKKQFYILLRYLSFIYRYLFWK